MSVNKDRFITSFPIFLLPYCRNWHKRRNSSHRGGLGAQARSRSIRRRTSGSRDKIWVVHEGIDQMVNSSRQQKPNFSLLAKRATSAEWEKTRMNPVVLDWKWRWWNLWFSLDGEGCRNKEGCKFEYILSRVLWTLAHVRVCAHISHWDGLGEATP